MKFGSPAFFSETVQHLPKGRGQKNLIGKGQCFGEIGKEPSEQGCGQVLGRGAFCILRKHENGRAEALNMQLCSTYLWGGFSRKRAEKFGCGGLSEQPAMDHFFRFLKKVLHFFERGFSSQR